MGTYTTNLNLYNTNMLTDGNDTFDFQRDLNDNNDKIDSAVGKLSTLSTTTQSSLVASINEVVSNCGALSNLSTTDKTSLVNAINELLSSLDGFATKSLGNLNATGQAIMDKKVEVEALLQQNGYAKFTWKENNQISNLLIQWGSCSKSSAGWAGVTLPLAYNDFYLITTAKLANSYNGNTTSLNINYPNTTLSYFQAGCNGNVAFNYITIGV